MSLLAGKLGFPLGGLANTGGVHDLFLYNMLILPLRQADEKFGNFVLKRFLDGPQYDWERTGDNIMLLLDQAATTKIRPSLLKYLKDIVGFTPELKAVTDRLDDTQLRKLIQVAANLWKERYSKAGIINSVRFLTGKKAIHSDWFYYRFLLGENMIGEDQLASGGDSWIIGGETSRYDESWSNLRLMDDGNLDETLLLEVCRLQRPVGERFEVFLLDFLDKFDVDLNLWTIVAGTPTIVSGELEAEDATIEPIVPIVSAPNQKDYVIVTKFRLDSATSADLEVRWYYDGVVNNDYYYLTIKPDDASEVSAHMYSTGSFPLFFKDFHIVRDTDYKLRIQTYKRPDGDNEISVYVDNILMGTVVDTTFSASITDGTFRFITTGKAWFDNVEHWRAPSRTATIELGTADERLGKITKSDNFVQ